MILAVIGSRSFDSYSFLVSKIEQLLFFKQITEIVSGGAQGADLFAKLYARTHNLKLKEFLPEWSRYGKLAGMKRNKLIVNYADVIIAFWDQEGLGTKHSIDFAKKLKKLCYIIDYITNLEYILGDKKIEN